eukprot:GEMP01056272.1.p1 GENE.GEMP01056272.1~~GEMP01056272.1.p1  ORF type:complete len:160 (+),score=20.99 GEMP01056272.1:19-498(+)
MDNRAQGIRDRMANRFEVDQKQALFGSRFGKTPQAVGNSAYDQHHQSAATDMMLQENDRKLEHLEGQVGLLKDITMNINGEVKRGNKLLDNFGIDMTKAADMMKKTSHSLNQMMQAKGGRHMWYMMAFVIFIFFLMWITSGHGGSSSVVVEPAAGSGSP